LIRACARTGLLCAGSVAVVLALAANSAAAALITSPIGSPIAPQTQEPVTDVQQPDVANQPVFDAFFTPPTGRPFDGRYTYAGFHVSVAVGGGYAYVSDEREGAVAVHDATTLAYVGALQDSGLRTPRGVSFYRGEVFVVDSDDAQVFVFDPQARVVKRTFQLPLKYVTADGYTVLDDVRITGVDVAWGEAWVSFLGTAGGGGVIALDSTTGTIKAVTWHLPSYDCTSNPFDIQFHENACTDDMTIPTQKGVMASCRTDMVKVDPKSPAVTFNLRRFNECTGAATPTVLDPDRFNWWDIATVPEFNGVLAQCRMINRGALATATTADDVTADDLLFDGDCAHGQFQDGTDAVWGMRWFLAVSGNAAGGVGTTVNEYRITQPTTGPGSRLLQGPVRTWAPMDAVDRQYRDVAYQNREARIDWKGPLAGNAWQHGNQCVDYIVSDADIYVVGSRGEHWFELARGFQKIDLIVDGTVRATSTIPKGQFCFDGDTVPSGIHALSLKAVVANGSKTVEARNDAYRVDHTPPSGTVTDPGHFVRGTVSLGGTMSDAHAGAADRQVQVQPNGGSWGDLCGLQNADDVGQAYACSWGTASGSFPDGVYNLRARMRDKVASSYGGANVGYSPVVATVVDNTAPQISAGGTLWGFRDLAPIEWGSPVDLHVEVSDAGSGGTHAEVLVDGVPRWSRDQGCNGGGCTLPGDISFVPEEHGEGRHTITVRANDQVGNQATEVSWIVDVEAPPPPTPDDQQDPSGLDQEQMAAVTAGTRAPLPADHPRAGLEDSLLNCTAADSPTNFDVYSAGTEFEGMSVSMVYRRCDLPYPGEGVRANFVSYIYGTCEPGPEDDTGCTPPMEVQSWPGCERSLADYALDESGAPIYDQLLTLRGVPGAAFERRLEVYTGDATVVVFGDDAAQIRRAIDVLRQEPSDAPPGMPAATLSAPGGLLPPPVEGATEGAMPCL
jgi:hypothetical protein